VLRIVHASLGFGTALSEHPSGLRQPSEG